MSRPVLEVRNLAVAFQGYRVLHDVSLALAAGECLGLVGESGSGKSTVLRTIVGLVERWHGQIAVLGENVSGASRARTLRRAVQMVFQDPYGSLYPRHTVARILAEPLAVAHLPTDTDRLVAALEDVGLGAEHLSRYPHQLSGGQRQRLAIARALILEPRVLLLDEPTSALDVSVQAEILNLLTRLRAEHDLSCILVSHNLAVTAHMCERVLVMAEGQIAEELSRGDLHRRRARTPAAQVLIDAALHRHRTTPV